MFKPKSYNHSVKKYILNSLTFTILKVVILKLTKIQTQMTLKTRMIFVIAVLIVATASILLYIPNQASAQITPSPPTLDSTGIELGFMAQNTTDPAQNSTVANITQLATVLPAVDQSVTPASFAPVNEESDESTSSSDDDDDDEDNDGSSDSSNDDDSSSDDDDDNGGSSSASAGGIFVSVG